MRSWKGIKFANVGQNIQILFENREKLENIFSIYMWGGNGVKLLTCNSLGYTLYCLSGELALVVLLFCHCASKRFVDKPEFWKNTTTRKNVSCLYSVANFHIVRSASRTTLSPRKAPPISGIDQWPLWNLDWLSKSTISNLKLTNKIKGPRTKNPNLGTDC